jgi:gamma-glutamyltranspeptidase / glutathione hydrolase
MRLRFFVLLGFCTSVIQVTAAEQQPIVRYDTIHHPTISRAGMVVSQRHIASEIGADILARGGNAVDAAVATGFAMAVVLPRAGNIGGGGFMLIHMAEQNETVAIDYRERAPAAATGDMFLDKDGNVDRELARRSLKSSGVPGSVAGLTYALEHYGSMSLTQVMKPAIELASKGFVIPWDLAEILKSRHTALTRNPVTARTFYKKDGVPYEEGEVFRQKDLARTLKLISRQGKDAFYRGRIADQLVALMVSGDGLITHQDLADYVVSVRQPVSGNYRGYRIVSMPPPSSGGVHIVQMLNILSQFPLAEYGAGSAEAVHLLTETMKLAYADRSKHLGDQDFYSVPSNGLVSQGYARQLASGIETNRARPASEISPGDPLPWESPDTTHFSVMDSDGNAVANTTTINFSFGNGIVVPGAGFLLNNEMDDFAAKPGVPNAYGLPGGAANAIEPGKRPLSSMTPTMVFKDNKPYLVTGSPGGSRIITTVLQVLVNVLDHGMNIADATHAPRFHHQWLPDRLEVEPGFSPDTLAKLRARGHNIKESTSQGSLQSIMAKDDLFFGAADPRRPSAGAVGP